VSKLSDDDSSSYSNCVWQEERLMIQGYPDQATVMPGNTITLRVSTDAQAFRVEFYRQGATLDYMAVSDWQDGNNAPDHPADQDWGLDRTIDGQFFQGWRAYSLPLASDLRPGIYIAMFVEGDGNGNERGNTPPLDRSIADARTGKALFVVQNPSPGQSGGILYKVSLLTYQAYNQQGGWSLYQQAPVTIRRPGGGTGGTPWDTFNFDPDEGDTPRQVFGHWDAPFVAWLEGNGYSPDYCTDLDIDADQSLSLLRNYRLLLSVGHDEYWTASMRDNVEMFIAQGGNVAFISGNTCWWQTTFDDPVTIRRTQNWYQTGRPENSLTGVSYRNAGEADEYRPSVGYVVQHSDHWVFQGTDLAEGQLFGFDEQLVGYECDGAVYDRSQPPPHAPTGQDGTPQDFQILGVGDVSSFAEQQGNAAATMGTYTRNGTVFTAATTDWPRVVARNGEKSTVQITRNVLSRLSASLQIVTGVAPGAASEGNTSVVAATSTEGRIFYNWWNLGQGGSGWIEMPGGGSTDAAPAAALVGADNDYLFAAVKGLDGNVYLNQGTLGGAFVGWRQVGFQTDAALGAASAGDTTVLVAKAADGRIFYTFWNLGQSGSGWIEMPGGGSTDAAPAAALVGADNDYLFAAVKGLDGNVYLNQGTLGGAFVGWRSS
jgi:hypothetical protein